MDLKVIYRLLAINKLIWRYPPIGLHFFTNKGFIRELHFILALGANKNYRLW